MKSNYALPISIVIVGILIAGAIFLIAQRPGATSPVGNPQTTRPVDSTDHIMGNPNAPIMVVEYADLECPYCKQFHITMHQIMDYYGPSGKVAWVFRNFPLGAIHSKAPREAEAAECAAAQGGSVAFFRYVDRLYAITPGENNLDLDQLPIIAKDVGLDLETFNQCLSSNQFAEKVQRDFQQAIAEGLQGTPHIVIMTAGGDALSLDGNQPYGSMREAIDQVLAQLGESVATTTTP